MHIYLSDFDTIYIPQRSYILHVWMCFHTARNQDILMSIKQDRTYTMVEYERYPRENISHGLQ
uniref:Uncharacterized protein n=1 Tax=Aegilops tauschii subsp. strangulata TaxID=200361 RepID=A0A453N535_AEGTS